MNQLTQVTDADEANYLATVTCDANGNITQIDERTGAGTLGNPYNYLYTYFEYDDLNRLTVHKDKQEAVSSAAFDLSNAEASYQSIFSYPPLFGVPRRVAGGTNAWVWTKLSHLKLGGVPPPPLGFFLKAESWKFSYSPADC